MTDFTPPQENPQEKNLPCTEPLEFWESMQSICLRPYKTIRHIVGFDPLYGQVHLFSLLVLSSALLDLKNGILGFLTALLIAAVFYAGVIYPTIASIWLSGKFLKGKATFSELCAAFLWALSPVIIGNVLAFSLSFILPSAVVTIIQLLAGIFGLKLSIATIAEVQGFSLWDSVINQLLGMVLLGCILIIPVIIFWGLIAASFLSLIHSMSSNLLPGF